MKNSTLNKIYQLSLRLFFVLSAFVYLVKVESADISAPDYSYHPNQDDIELIISGNSDYGIVFIDGNPGAEIKSRVISAGIAGFYLNSVSLKRCDNYLNHQTEPEYSSYSPINRMIGILRKSNIHHLSSDDDPHLFC
jgi:hypothetical protein